jgi:hypothetical protein
MTTTTGRFELTSWDEETIDEADGTRRVRARNTKSFQGGITGESATDLLQGFAGEGTATYVAIERVTAAVDGRKGGFLLRHSALMADGGGDMLVDVVPNSGTGELAGLTGTMTITMVDGEHTYAFDYAL